MRVAVRKNIVMASVAIAAGLGWVALLVTFSLTAPLNTNAAQQASRSPAPNATPLLKSSVDIKRASQAREPTFTHVRLSRLSKRGLFAGRGEPDARIVLLKGYRAMADARIDSQGKWQIATAITAEPGLHRYTLEQRLAGADRYITGQQIRLFVPAGFRHTVDVTTEPDSPGFSLVAVAADSDDIGSAASRRFDQFLKEQDVAPQTNGARGNNAQVAERGDVLDPAWRWLEDASRSYHREVVPRIRRRGNDTWQTAAETVAQRGDGQQRDNEQQNDRRRWDDGERDGRQPVWPSIGMPEGLSQWFASARRGYSSEVVPRLKGQVPVVTVARPNPEQKEKTETDQERRERLARERALEEDAVAKAERERREAERRRLEAQKERRRAEDEATRLADQSRKAAEEERKRAEAQRLEDEEEAKRLAAERKRALERRAEEERRLAEAARLREAAETRDRTARDVAVAQENERLARLERTREDEARRLREATEARERERASLEADERRRRFEEIVKQREAAAAQQRKEAAREQEFSQLQRERADAAKRRREAEAERDRITKLASERREEAQRRRDAETERDRLQRERRDARRLAQSRWRGDNNRLPPVPARRVVAKVKLPEQRPRDEVTRGNRTGDRYVFRDTRIEYSRESARSSRAGNTRRETPTQRPIARETKIDRDRIARKRSTTTGTSNRTVNRRSSRQPVKRAIIKRSVSRPAKQVARKRKPVRVAQRRTVRSRSIRNRRTRALRVRLAKARKRRVSRSQRTSCHARAGRRIAPPGTYVVRRGDSLWKISRRHYRLGRYFRTIYRANPKKIRKLRLIFPCQRFHLPRRAKG